MCVEGKPSKTNAVYLAFRTAGLPLDIWIWIAPMYSSAHKQLVYTDRPAVSKFSVSRIYIDSGLQVVKIACPPSSLDQGFRYTTLLIYRLFSIGCLSPFIQYCVFYILKAFYCIWQLSAKSRILPYEGNIIFTQCATGLNCFGLITSFTYILHQGVEPKLQYHIGPLLIITTPDFVDQAKNGFLFK